MYILYSTIRYRISCQKGTRNQIWIDITVSDCLICFCSKLDIFSIRIHLVCPPKKHKETNIFLAWKNSILGFSGSRSQVAKWSLRIHADPKHLHTMPNCLSVCVRRWGHQPEHHLSASDVGHLWQADCQQCAGAAAFRRQNPHRPPGHCLHRSVSRIQAFC
jgi:hypothetical protein